MAANTHIFYVSIAVYCGEPFDYQRYRHTALCFRPALPPTPSVSAPPSPPLSSTELTATPPLSDSGPTDAELHDGIERLGHADPDLMSGPAIIMHVVCGRNNGGHWELSVLASTVPAEMPNKSFAKEVPVGALLRPLSKAQLVSMVSQTPLDNEDPEFNCQVWVESALMRLSSDKFLNFDDYHNGLDSMVDATMEAADEVCM